MDPGGRSKPFLKQEPIRFLLKLRVVTWRSFKALSKLLNTGLSPWLYLRRRDRRSGRRSRRRRSRRSTVWRLRTLALFWGGVASSLTMSICRKASNASSVRDSHISGEQTTPSLRPHSCRFRIRFRPTGFNPFALTSLGVSSMRSVVVSTPTDSSAFLY